MRNSVSQIVLDLLGQNEDLGIAAMKLLTVAARYQVASHSFFDFIDTGLWGCLGYAIDLLETILILQFHRTEILIHFNFLFLQPALLVAIFDSSEDSDAGNLKQSGEDASSVPDWACKSRLLHTILQYLERATDFVDRYVKS